MNKPKNRNKKVFTFRNLEFGKHAWAKEGLQAVKIFPNGYGVSVVRFKLNRIPGLADADIYGSYTRNEKQWEVAIIQGTEKSWHLTYSTPIANDIIGYCDRAKVNRILKKVQALKRSR